MRPDASDPCNGFGGGHGRCAIYWTEPGVGIVYCHCPCHDSPQVYS